MKNPTGARALMLLCAAIFAVDFAAAQSDGQIHFFKNDLESAENLAARSAKPILFKFTAKWCLPCRVMEETVWANPDVVELVSKNFVALAVDVQNFDGFALKDRFSVQSLPTLLVTDATGLVLARRESACGIGQLMDWLENYGPLVAPASIAEVDFMWTNPQEFLGNRTETSAGLVVFSTQKEVGLTDVLFEKMAADGSDGWPVR